MDVEILVEVKVAVCDVVLVVAVKVNVKVLECVVAVEILVDVNVVVCGVVLVVAVEVDVEVLVCVVAVGVLVNVKVVVCGVVLVVAVEADVEVLVCVVEVEVLADVKVVVCGVVLAGVGRPKTYTEPRLLFWYKAPTTTWVPSELTATDRPNWAWVTPSAARSFCSCAPVTPSKTYAEPTLLPNSSSSS